MNKPDKYNAFQWLGRGEDAKEVWVPSRRRKMMTT